MRALVIVTRETLLLLRRDRIFLPALAASVTAALAAEAVSDWSVEEFFKILFDVGYFGLQLLGIFVSLFWGIKSITDSRQQGALEVQLAAPISRPTWLIGKFLGLAIALTALGVIQVAIFQVFMRFNDFGWLTPPEIAAFVLMIEGWIVLAALATLFASFCGQAVAMFSALALYIVGLGSSLVANTLNPNAPASTRAAVEFVARLWDFQQFNVVEPAVLGGFPGRAELWARGGYGLVLILILVSIACVVFSRRDAIS